MPTDSNGQPSILEMAYDVARWCNRAGIGLPRLLFSMDDIKQVHDSVPLPVLSIPLKLAGIPISFEERRAANPMTEFVDQEIGR
jgi:hypothetical protein